MSRAYDKTYEPLFTAIIPIYNGEKHLKETLDNIQQMKYPALELFLIDDGSSDNSGKICREYAASDERIHYLRQENQGIAAARNRGLDLAKGEYVCFWDQDDIVKGEGYFELLHKIEGEGADMGMCSTNRLIRGKESHFERMQDSIYSSGEVRSGLLYSLLFRGYQYNFAHTSNYFYGSVWKCIFRTDFIRKYHMRFRRFVSYEDDWLFVMQALCYAQKVVTTSRAGYCWRVSENSESHRGAYIENLPEKFGALDQFVFEQLRNSIKDKKVLDAYEKVCLSEHYVELYRNATNALASDKKECYKELKQYLCKTNYKEQLWCRNKLKKFAYRRLIVLNSLQYGGITITYVVSRAYDRLEYWMERKQWIVNIERKKKLK